MESATESTEKLPLVYRILGRIEAVGNMLPHPATLFVILAVLVVVISAITAGMGVSVTHPGTGKEVKAVSLLTIEGLHRILTSLVTNFTGFAPLGTVLVALLGISVAEASGFISAILRLVVIKAPAKLLTLVVVFAGVVSHIASDVGYVVVIPLGAVIFYSVGRNPLVGLAAAFAGVSGGFSANLLLGPTDTLLAGITQEAARIYDPSVIVTPAANYYFMATSAFLVAIAGTLVTEKIIAPRLGKYEPKEGADLPSNEMTELQPNEKRGLLFAGIAILLFAGVIIAGLVPEGGFLRDPKTGSVLTSPFLSGIVAVIFFGGVITGLSYAFGAKTMKNDSDVMTAMEGGMKTLAAYLVLAFFAAQFVAFFNWTNLGVITAVEGADLLKSLNITGVPLIVSMVIVTVILDLFVGSASAKWAVMAPVFVPMLMILGYSPEITQAAYRIGDSVANIITPLMSYFPLIVVFARKYDPSAGIGTIMAMMMPYSVVFFLAWTLLLVVWYLFGLPLGPGAEIYYQQPQN
ncbi:MAG: AbgT family transporter [Pyrinomonadaceae bacterium]|nr:AbgT family transporter [Pyrinomonadaceae bacterium]